MQKGFTVLLMAICALFTPGLVHGQAQTVGLFTKDAGEQDGYVLFSPGSSDITYMIDKCGKLVHQWNTKYDPGADAYIMANGDLLSTGNLKNADFNSAGSAGGIVQIFDWNGNLVWRHQFSDTIIHQDHDVYPMPNGDILVLEWERFTPQQCRAAGRDSATLKNNPLWSARIQEIKPIGTDSAAVVWDWHLWDHLIQDNDSTKSNFGVVANHPELLNINYTDPTETGFGASDWIHANAVTYNADLDQVMFSSRNLSEIYIIDHSTSTAEAATHSGGNHGKGGDFMYRWGNPAVYNRGTSTNRTLWVQHNPSWIPDGYPGAGNITVFNDGTARRGGNYSSADILAPPVDANGNYKLDSGKSYGPDSAYWSYVAPVKTNFYSSVQGGVEKLPNGDVLICESTKGNFFEVDTNKNILWRYVNSNGGYGPVAQTLGPGNNVCFRAMQYMENYSAFNHKVLKPGAPIELDPYNYVCNMPYIYTKTPLYKIAQLKGNVPATGVADSLGKGQGFIQGVVESQDLGQSNIEFSIADSTGSITVVTNESYYVPSVGDSIMVGGYVTQADGLTEYNADTIFFSSRNSLQIKPQVVTQLGEGNESGLVTIDNVRLVDTTQWAPTGEPFDVQITNGIDTFTMLVNNRADLYFYGPPNEEFDVTGIEIQDKDSQPYFGDYEIEPRSSFDIVKVDQLYKIRQVRVQSPVTGVADSAGSPNAFYLKGVVQDLNYVTSGLEFSMEDSTGAIMVISADDLEGYSPATGDSIEIKGLLTQFDGQTEVVADSISLLNQPSVTLTPNLVPALAEQYEAQLVKLNSYYVVDTSKWTGKGNGFIVQITNGTDTVGMYIGETTNLYKMKALYGPFNVTGIELQDQPKSPYFGNYLIAPRGLFDIERYIQMYNIKQVRVQNAINGVSDSAGNKYRFLLKGIVQSPDFTNSGYIFSIKDSTGSIFVVAATPLYGYSPSVGDSVEVRGLVIQTNGVTSIAIDSIAKLTNSPTTLSPRVITNLNEGTEAALVKYDNAWLVDPTQWIPLGTAFTVDITNGKDTLQLYITNATDLYGQPAPLGKFNVTGIGYQDKPSMPYIGGYQLMPRDFDDFQFPPYYLYKIRQVKGYDPVTGIADSINTYCYLKGIVQTGNLSGRKTQYFTLEDSTGAIAVTVPRAINGYSPNIGDSIQVRGTVLQLKGLTHFTPDSVSSFAKGLPISPVVVPALNENNESGLLTLKNYILADSTQWDTTGANGSFQVVAYGLLDTVTLQIVAGTDLYTNAARPKDSFDVTGIEGQSDAIEPYFSGYYLIPRSTTDFNIHVPAQNTGFEAPVSSLGTVQLFPNPTSGTVNIKAGFSIAQVQVTDMLGKTELTLMPDAATATLDISSLHPGIYLVRVSNGIDATVARIVKN